jgi:hypothetical protein
LVERPLVAQKRAARRMFVVGAGIAMLSIADLRAVYGAGNAWSGLPAAGPPRGDNGGDQSTREHGDKGLPVDLSQLADGREQHREHEHEHPCARRQGAHQVSAGER